MYNPTGRVPLKEKEISQLNQRLVFLNKDNFWFGSSKTKFVYLFVSLCGLEAGVSLFDV